jgi:hypothetical protein
MPIYYLHQRSGDDRQEDLDGAVYKDLETAVDQAVRMADQRSADMKRQGLDAAHWNFEITNELGAIQAVVPFEDTMGKDGKSDPAQHVWFRIDA